MVDPPQLATWIRGEAEPCAVDDGRALCDPNDGRPLQDARSSSPEQVERALAAAHESHRAGSWASLGTAGRVADLQRFVDALDEHVEEIAVLDAVNSGVPVAFTRMFAASLATTARTACRLAGERGDEEPLSATQGPVRLRRVPWGPTAVICPWNAPSAVAVKKLAYALVAGNPVVLKPSPESPWSAQTIAAAAASTLPPGVLGVVLGGTAVGRQVCSDARVRAISMTGSTPTGQAIAAAAGRNLTRLQLELGSTNPVVVRADADVACTAQSLFDGMTKLNGQWCEAPRAVFADHAVHRDLVDALAALVEGATLGSSLLEDTKIGPMAFAGRQEQLRAQRDELLAGGRRLVAATREPDAGWFFGPTIVDGTGPDLGDEVFGPMLTLEAVPDDSLAVLRANVVAGGLAAYVFGEDVDAAIALGGSLVGGEVKVNGTSLLDMSEHSAQSFFGLSGIGGHGDRDVLDFYSGKQVVGRDLVGAPL